MTLEVFGETDAQQWDDIVNSSLNGTLYHTWNWLKITEKHSDSKLYPLVFFDTREKKPFGAIPLFFMKKLGMKMVFSPPPGCSIRLGPVLLDKGYKQHKFELAYLDFQAGIDSFIQQLGSSYTSIITNPGLLDVRPFSWADYEVTPAYTYFINLSPGTEKLWAGLKSNVRSDINSAQKKGVSVEESTSESAGYFYDSIAQRYSKLRQRFPLNRSYLFAIFEKFKPANIRTFTALYQDQVMTATACTLFKDTVTAWIGSVSPPVRGLEANKLVYWNIIIWAVKNNFRSFEIEGANIQHLCSYKSIFNPGLRVYFGIKKMDRLGYLGERSYRLMRKSSF